MNPQQNCKKNMKPKTVFKIIISHKLITKTLSAKYVQHF